MTTLSESARNRQADIFQPTGSDDAHDSWFELTAAQRQLESIVRGIIQKDIAPRAAEVDRLRQFPRHNITALAQAGLLGMLVPRDQGGLGSDHTSFAIVIEEIAATCASTSGVMDVHVSVGTEPLVFYGTAEQRQRYLPGMIRGDILAGFALTEPGSGSDAVALRTTARRDGDTYILDGTKMFISNCGAYPAADTVFTVMASTDLSAGAKGIGAFLVPGNTPGVIMGRPFAKMGLHGATTAELSLADCRIPATNLLGQEGQGFTIAMHCLDYGRIGISAQAVGIARGALGEAIAHLKQRGNVTAGEQAALADLATLVDAARLLTRQTAQVGDRGQRITRLAAEAKLFSTDAAMTVTTEVMNLVGPAAASETLPFARYFRDAKAAQIYEGTNQVQRIVISRALLADQ